MGGAVETDIRRRCVALPNMRRRACDCSRCSQKATRSGAIYVPSASPLSCQPKRRQERPRSGLRVHSAGASWATKPHSLRPTADAKNSAPRRACVRSLKSRWPPRKIPVTAHCSKTLEHTCAPGGVSATPSACSEMSLVLLTLSAPRCLQAHSVTRVAGGGLVQPSCLGLASAAQTQTKRKRPYPSSLLNYSAIRINAADRVANSGVYFKCWVRPNLTKRKYAILRPSL
jgi:hypothetical protein